MIAYCREQEINDHWGWLGLTSSTIEEVLLIIEVDSAYSIVVEILRIEAKDVFKYTTLQCLCP